MLEIIYQDEYIVAINKPHGLLVHPTSLARDAEVFAMQMLRDQLGQHVHPVHRLDRKTGGVLLFALDKEIHKSIQLLFAERKVFRKYWAIVRGYCEEEGVIDYPLKKENGSLQEAITVYKTLSRAALPIPFGQHDSIRFSLIEVRPETGRMHQIRKHMAHISHPIIGDRPHGCNKQNKLFKERWGMDTMLLHAGGLSFAHPVNRSTVNLLAPVQDEFLRMMETMGWDKLMLQ